MEDQSVEISSKHSYLEDFADLRPDLFFPGNWTPEQKDKVSAELRPRKVRTAMYSSIPMLCRGDACPYAAVCPLFKQNIHPINHSCHPAGTMIYTRHHGQIPIEDLDPDLHTLVGFERKYSAIRPGRKGHKFKLQSKHYCGFMVNISTENGGYQATHDHVCVAKFNEKALGKFCVYLMRKDDHWRVGKSCIAKRIKKQDSIHKTHLSFPMRGAMEEADSMWILGVYDTNTEALLAEESFSLFLQTSKTSFVETFGKIKSKHDGLYKWATQEQMHDHHESWKHDEKFYREKLTDMGLSVDYPIWERGGKDESNPETNLYVKWPMFIRACNIIPGIMDVPLISDDNLTVQPGINKMRIANWEEVSISKEGYCGTVYSLDVEAYKTYFAGNIATHNCPLEMAIVVEFTNNYMREFGVNPENLVEVSMVRDLVDFEVQYMRAVKILAQEHFIAENVVGVDHEGEVLVQKQLHQAVEYEEKILKRKERVLNAFLATREARTKAGQGLADASQQISTLMDQVREHTARTDKLTLKKMGVPVIDAYIQADMAGSDGDTD